MIKINKIPTQILEHFENEKSLGFLNQDEHYDLRCQIKENQSENFYLIFQGEKVKIETDGNLSSHPKGMYDTSVNLLNRLFGI